MSTPQDRVPPPADEAERVDQIVDQIKAGAGLGGRHLGKLGTTGGTQIGAEMQQETETGVPGGRIPAGHPYDPGMAGRTARGGLGSDLDPLITGQQADETARQPADAEDDAPPQRR